MSSFPRAQQPSKYMHAFITFNIITKNCLTCLSTIYWNDI